MSSVLNDQAVILLLTGMAVLYHVCMQNDAKLLKKVKEPASRGAQSVKNWFTTKLQQVRTLVVTLLLSILVVSCM